MKIKTLLKLSVAEGIAGKIFSIGKQEKMHPLTVVILDAGGSPVLIKRQDGSGIMRVDIAFGKAWGSLGMGISSRLMRDRLADRPTFLNALASVSGGRLIPVPGGVLIYDKEGEAIGAVGVSGDTSDKDEYCAIAAIKAEGYKPEPGDPSATWRESNL